MSADAVIGAVETPTTTSSATAARPRLGFVGTGWIGRHRMEAIVAADVADVVAVCDASPECVSQAIASAPGATAFESLEAMLEAGLDGVVIATPSAMHAEQAITALERGVAVFCQKPLARTAGETRRVVDAARSADRLLGVDLSYRETQGMSAIRRLVQAGEIGDVYAVDLVFHNAYGPDKSWFYDPALAGGGCVIDLGIHLVDLVLWTLGFPAVGDVSGRLYAKGQPITDPAREVEDYAVATIDLAGGTTVRLACSWHLSAGQDAVIEAAFYGTKGGAAFRNVNGSFYDFTAQLFHGTSRQLLAEPPDAWGGRAATLWAQRLANGKRFDADVERLVDVAAALDAIYGRAGA